MATLTSGLSPDDDGALTIGLGSAAGQSTPGFLTRALSWVEFRRIALRRQWHYSIDSPGEGACEPLVDKRLGLTL